MNLDDNETIARAIKTYGYRQMDKTIEECAELIVAIRHWKDSRSGCTQGLLDEIADVSIMVAQLRLLLPGVDDAIASKLARLEARLDRGER